MNSDHQTSQPVMEALRRAAGVHARQRAMLFLLRSLWCLAAMIPLLMIADVLLHFSGPLRMAGTIGMLLAAMAVILAAAVMACLIRPPMLRMARLLESRNPALGSKLVNILQLDADSRREELAPLTRDLARHAVAAAGKGLDLPSLPRLAREPHLPRRALQALAAPLLLLVLTVFGGPHVRQEWLRFLDPFGDHPPFSLTRLEILKPVPTDEVLYGGSVLVEVKASGHQPRGLFVTATPIGTEGAPRVVPLVARGDGTFAVRLENLREPMELTAHTADHATRSHRRTLGLVMTPQLGAARVRLTPPPYTGQAPRDLPFRYTALQALEGTEIEFEIASNRPLGEGAVTLETDAGAADTPLAPDAAGPPEAAVARITAERSGRLTFSLVDVAGNPAATTPTSSFTVTRDQPPAIAISVPESDALVVEGLTVPVMVDATDDYGLRSIRLHLSINDEFLPLTTVVFDEPDVRRHRLEHPLDLALLGAADGDRIVIFAEAVDTRPDPQITRTTSRRLEVITEDQYNDYLREQADVAMIAGKYEQMLERFYRHVEEQRRIEETLAALAAAAAADPEADGLDEALAKAFAEQTEFNRKLEELATGMEEFGRDQPVYDFEKELHEALAGQAAMLRESAAANDAEMERALESAPAPPVAADGALAEALAEAARSQRERLEGGHAEADEQVREPLEELARLHELMKSFNRFQQLTDEQQELADQSKAYDGKPELNAEDRLALRDLGARQRELARQLEQLANKLEADADAADDIFPEAAGSARELAGAIDAAGMPGLARRAAQNLLDAKGDDGHAQAQHLFEEMDRLCGEAGAAGQAAVAQGLDRALSLRRGMNPGDSLRQMMLSKNFRMPGSGASGAGEGGFMATAAIDGNVQLLGGESLMDGAIAGAINGRGDGDGPGSPGTPTARLEEADRANLDAESARRTGTPGASSLLSEYENIADAYFRRLTTKP